MCAHVCVYVCVLELLMGPRDLVGPRAGLGLERSTVFMYLVLIVTKLRTEKCRFNDSGHIVIS